MRNLRGLRAIGKLIVVTTLAALHYLGFAAAAQAQPTFSANYAPGSVGQGGVSMLTYVIGNGAAVPAQSLDFSHTLPVNVTLADPPEATTDCTGGTITAVAGGSSVAYTGGSVPGLSSCSVSVKVTSGVVGSYSNSTGDLTSDAGNSGTATTNSLAVSTSVPSFTQSFAPTTVSLNGRSTLTYVIDNSANANDLSSLVLNDDLPGGIRIADPANASTTCGGPNPQLTATAGGSNISFQSFGILFPGFEVLLAGAACSITVDVVGTTLGAQVNNSGELTSNAGSSGVSLATLTVTGAPADAPLVSKRFDGDPVNPGDMVEVEYTIRNTARFFPATDVAFSDDLDGALSGLVATGAPITNSCGGTVSGTSVLSLTGGTIAAGATCTILQTLTVPAGAPGGTFASATDPVTAAVDGVPVVGNAASDNLFVNGGGGAPVLTLDFTDGVQGGTLNASFDITNASAGNALSDLGPVSVGCVRNRLGGAGRRFGLRRG